MSFLSLRPIARLRRFARAKSGATAVEFALVGLPFMALLFGIVELGLVFMVSTTLDTATENAARRIRTGEFQTGGANTKADFKTLVCGGMSWLGGACAANLYVEVQTFANFTNMKNAPNRNPTTFNPAATCWATGNAGDIVLVRTYYQWTLITPLLNRAMENATGTGKRLISAAAAFRSEPYADNTTPSADRC